MKTHNDYKSYFSSKTWSLIERDHLSIEQRQPTNSRTILITDSMTDDISLLKNLLVCLTQVKISQELHQKILIQAQRHISHLEKAKSTLIEQMENSCRTDLTPQDMIQLLERTESSLETLFGRLNPLVTQWEKT